MSLVIVPMWLTVQPPTSKRASASPARPVVLVLFMTTIWKLFAGGAEPLGASEEELEDDCAEDDEDGTLTWVLTAEDDTGAEDECAAELEPIGAPGCEDEDVWESMRAARLPSSPALRPGLFSAI